MRVTPTAPVDWGVAARPKPGETLSGDRAMVLPFDGGTVVAVVDGLGHGSPAAADAEAAERILREDPANSVIALAKRCHDALRGARGVVMSLAQIDAGQSTLTWLSIGNVEGVLVQPAGRARLINRGGVVGSALPPLRAEVIDVAQGGLLVFATDGVAGAFADDVALDSRPPRDIADDLLRRFGRQSDDELVLVARLPAAERP